MTLPNGVRTLVEPLFQVLPLERAMPSLVSASMSPPVGAGGGQYENPMQRAYEAASRAVDQLYDHATLQAAIWLYVDDLERSHRICQNIDSPLGAYLHGIVHRREGDFSNAKYWFRQAQDVQSGIDPISFVEEVAADQDQNSPELVERQRAEWLAVFQLGATEASSR